MKHTFSLFLAIFLLFAMLPTFPASAVEDEIVMGNTTTILPAIGATQLLTNGGFEDVTGNRPYPWTLGRGNWGSAGEVIDRNPKEGTKCLKIDASKSISPYNPLVQQGLAVQDTAVYQMSVWVKKTGSSSATSKLEFYGDNGDIRGYTTFSIVNNHGVWQQVIFNFLAPLGAKSCLFSVRVHGNTDMAFFDDARVYMVRAPRTVTIEPDSYFYYPEQNNGTAVATVNLGTLPTLTNPTMDFSLLDSDNTTVLTSRTDVPVTDGEALFSYDVNLLSEKKTAYTIRARLYSGGALLDTAEREIYKYDRPQFLKADGRYVGIDANNQPEEIEPVLGYAVYTAVDPNCYEKCREAGINVIQGSVSILDEAWAHGLRVFVPLYQSMEAAGHPSNRQKTIDTVTQYMHHPAVFGWAIMDEPFLNLTDPMTDLANSYKIIRDIDPYHPVLAIEGYAQKCKEVGKCVDLVGHDPYVWATMDTDVVYEATKTAVAATNGLKPVVIIVQSFKSDSYIPSAQEIRHMTHQAFLGGAAMFGYYCITKADGTTPVYSLPDTDIWDGMKSLGNIERQTLYDIFVRKSAAGFHQSMAGDVWYYSYVKNGTLYLTAMNTSTTATKTISVPLTSYDGRKTISNGIAVAFAGTTTNRPFANGVLSLSLAPCQTATYTIAADFAGYTATDFDYAVRTDRASGATDTFCADLGIITGSGTEITTLPIANGIVRGVYGTARGIIAVYDFIDGIKKLTYFMGTDGVINVEAMPGREVKLLCWNSLTGLRAERTYVKITN